LRYLFEDYAFDTDRRELHRGADVVTIAPQVFDLLDYLIRNRERVVSKDDLINAIWNGRIVSDGALTTRLNGARSAIGDSGDEHSASSKPCHARASVSSEQSGKRRSRQVRQPPTTRKNRRNPPSRSPINPRSPYSPSPT
jgi:hypothetical protein